MSGNKNKNKTMIRICYTTNARPCHRIALCNDTRFILGDSEIRNAFFQLYKQSPNHYNPHFKQQLNNFLANYNISKQHLKLLAQEIYNCRKRDQNRYNAQQKIKMNRFTELSTKHSKEVTNLEKQLRNFEARPNSRYQANILNGLRRMISSVKQKQENLSSQYKHNVSNYTKHQIELNFWKWIANA